MATPKTPRTSSAKPPADEPTASDVPAADTPKPASRKRAAPKAADSKNGDSKAGDAKSATAPAKPAPPRRSAAKPATGRRAPATKSGRKPADKAPAAGRVGKVAWSLGGLALAAGAGVAAFLTRGRIAALFEGKPTEGHVPTDLLDPNRNADDRAVADFRPNMDAPMTAGERAALAPATGPSPSLVAEPGEMRSQVGPLGSENADGS